MRKTFPKNKEQELRQLVKDQRVTIQKLETKVKTLEAELKNIQKPLRKRAPPKTEEEKRQDYIKELKNSIRKK